MDSSAIIFDGYFICNNRKKEVIPFTSIRIVNMFYSFQKTPHLRFSVYLFSRFRPLWHPIFSQSTVKVMKKGISFTDLSPLCRDTLCHIV
jgi:hypothetical protein